ncbi:MAG TPA: DUF2637 domain-containing protein [Actinocrinis sp.]|uniref:DUF2637 domain-containing protein n=1 Tax=Actinocrinis sp. TaxID=1920516 RepID=UPI002DDCCD05|nr:DUF2637 domain-containing protein [Actinocrinis sp.]HEV2347381.1 DUF2637 domain-containing protein [Actinocrinis sp.]
MGKLRRFTDGVVFQAVLTGSLSFSHIHDLAAAHGQAGWKAWLYPLSVDLLTVAAYRKLMAARSSAAPTGLAWWAFLLGLAASLAANIAAVWQNPDRFVAVSLGVWPAVAFLVCTLLSHDSSGVPDAVPVPVPVAVPVPAEAPRLAANAPSDPPVTRPRTPRDADGKEWADLVREARQVDAKSRATTGKPAGITRLRKELKVGQDRAQRLRDHLAGLPTDPPSGTRTYPLHPQQPQAEVALANGYAHH